MSAHTETVMATPYVRKANTQHGIVAALLVARVIVTAQTLWETERAEEQAGAGYSEEAYRAAQEARVAAEENYHQVQRLASAAIGQENL